MNWDRIEGNWKQFKGKAKEKWGKLTDDDLDVVSGKRDQLAGRIQERYGIAKDDAERWPNRTRSPAIAPGFSFGVNGTGSRMQHWLAKAAGFRSLPRN
jgi:uncharacterized protein YjbJ (UPF0337 family)